MKPWKFAFLLLVTIFLLVYGNIVMGIRMVEGTGHNQGGFGDAGQDSCGNVEVTTVSDNCPSGNDAINSYVMSVTVKNVNASTPLTLTGEWRTYWCTPSQLRSADDSIGQNAGSCYENGQTFFPISSPIGKGESYTFTSPTRTANACIAIYQNDFNYSYMLNGKRCQNSTSSIHYHAAYGYCRANRDCETPTPTSIPTSPTPISPSPIVPSPTIIYPSPTLVMPSSFPQNSNTNNNTNTQQQSENQYNNNNQSVNVTYASQQQPTQAVLGTTTIAPAYVPQEVTQLPSTGSPADMLELLGSLTPLGIFLRKIA